MNEENEPTTGDEIAAIGNVLREISQNRKLFDEMQADRYEEFVRSLTSEADAIARRQLWATVAAAIAAIFSAGVAFATFFA